MVYARLRLRMIRLFGRTSGVLRSSLAISKRAFSDSTNNNKSKTILPRVTYNSNLETEHQRAFGAEAYLEEVSGDVQTVTGWGIGQFRINGNKVTGPIVLTKTLAFRWNLDAARPTVKDLKIEDFELFTIMKPALDLIILGTGDKIEYPSKDLLKQLRSIAPVEILDSVNAGATFNVLSKEDRSVAAALLPVQEWTK